MNYNKQYTQVLLFWKYSSLNNFILRNTHKCNRGMNSSVVQKRFVEDFIDRINAEGVLRPNRHWTGTNLINVK